MAKALDWSDPWLHSPRPPGSFCWKHSFRVRGSQLSQVVECHHTPSLTRGAPWGCWGNWATLGFPCGILNFSILTPLWAAFSLAFCVPRREPFLLPQEIRGEMGREGTDLATGPQHFISLPFYFLSYGTFPSMEYIPLWNLPMFTSILLNNSSDFLLLLPCKYLLMVRSPHSPFSYEWPTKTS